MKSQQIYSIILAQVKIKFNTKVIPNSTIQKYNKHNFIEQYDQRLSCGNFALAGCTWSIQIGFLLVLFPIHLLPHAFGVGLVHVLYCLQKFQELYFQLLHPPCTGVQGNFNDGKSAHLTFSLLKKIITKCYQLIDLFNIQS